LKLHGFKHLKLDFKYRRKIPDSIFSHTQIERLELTAYRVKKLSKLIGKLTMLKDLNLYLSNVTTLPKEFGKLQQLKKLYLSMSSKIEIEIPLCISELSALESWHMSYTVINFLKEFEQLTALNYLKIKISENCSTEDREHLEKLLEKIKSK